MNSDLLDHINTPTLELGALSVPLVRSSGETGGVLVQRMSYSFPVSHAVCCVSNLTVLVGS